MIQYNGQVGIQCKNIYHCPILIKQKIEEERRLRRCWHQLRTPESKRLLNTATQELKQLLNNNKNDCNETFLQGLTPTEATDYSLWKATKKIKQVKKPSPPLRTSQGTRARNNVKKAHAFNEHLQTFFSCILQKLNMIGKKHLHKVWRLPTNSNGQEVQEVINSLNPKKSSGYDLITGKILIKNCLLLE
jgi:hypothetical protein